MSSKKTLRELSKNQEQWTDEDIESLKNLAKATIELQKATEPYNINKKKSNNNTIYLNYYKEYTIISAIFETFIQNDNVHFKDIIQSIHNNSTNTLFYDLTTIDIKIAIHKMIRLGYISIINKEEKYNPVFGITDLGIKCNSQQIIQNIAATSFTNYQTFILNKRAEKTNIIMLLVTITSLIIAVCSIYVTIKNSK